MRFLRNQWFLAVLFLATGMGYWFAFPLKFLTEIPWLKWSIVSFTMLLMTWPLELKTLLKAATSPAAPLIACIVNLLVAPILAWPLSWLLGDELGPGLILASAVPSTLASAAVWARRAGGNDSVSLVVTIVTNLLCFAVTPIWVFALIGIEVPEQVLYATVYNLFLFVVAPMVVGQILRINSSCAQWATDNKPQLALVAQFGILAMVLLGSINMGIRVVEHPGTAVSLNLLAITLVIVLGLHLALFYLGVELGKWTGCTPEDQIAIGFSGSQKTLMVGLSTAISMGLNIIPIVAYHALQLFVDTLIADRFRARLQKHKTSFNSNVSDTNGNS